MERDRVKAREEELVAMDETEYNKGLAMAILPDDYNYIFEDIKVISEMDEHGEIKMEISARVDVKNSNDLTTFIEEFYATSGSNFNIKSGRQDRKGKNTEKYGYRKCIMQVKEKKRTNPKRKGLHQDCPADLTFRLDIPKVIIKAQLVNGVRLYRIFKMIGY
jgi:hypothetical protein